MGTTIDVTDGVLTSMTYDRVNTDPVKAALNHYISDNPNVNPAHYKSSKGFEVIDVIEEYTEGMDGKEGYFTGNILKYICRWKRKNGLEDLEKAAWYLNELIKYEKD